MSKIGSVLKKLDVGEPLLPQRTVSFPLALNGRGIFFFLIASATTAQAANIQFTAEVDRLQISKDEAVTLHMVVQSDEAELLPEPEFQAPDFDIIDSFSGQTRQMTYDSVRGAHTSIRFEYSKVLQPHGAGNLPIRGIKLKANGKVFNTPEILVRVTATPQSSNPQNRNNPSGPGGVNRGQQQAQPAEKVGFLQSEVSKTEAVKGEQIIISYYLYHQTKVFNVQVDKFPVLSGFLREDLEMPLLTQRFDTQQAVVNGIPYFRTLLARYAAYPLQVGELSIDSMSTKFNYFPRQQRNAMDEDNPIFGFFQQLAPRVAASQSEVLKVKVDSLPSEGKPDTFTGGVGDFTIDSAIDKTEVHANEALSLTLKIEGKGGLATVQPPKLNWNNGVELFESKGKDYPGKGGQGLKVFELLLIPRIPGKLTLPPITLSFYNPTTKTYETKSTQPIELNVLEPLPGSIQASPTGAPFVGQAEDLKKPSEGTPPPLAKGLKPPTPEAFHLFDRVEIGKVLWAACGGALAFLISLLLRDRFTVRRRRREELELQKGKSLAQLKQEWQKVDWSAVTRSDLLEAYETLQGRVFRALGRGGLGKSSEVHPDSDLSHIPRSELLEALSRELNISPERAKHWVEFLDFKDLLFYSTPASNSGAGSAVEIQARSQFLHWVDVGVELVSLHSKFD